MICKSCNFENKEGAAFCAECGNPLQDEKASDMKPMENPEDKTVIIDTVVTDSKESVDEKVETPKVDDSEADTSVLTSNMMKKPAGPAPVQPMAPMGPGAMAPAQPMGAPMNQASQMKPAGAPQGQVPPQPMQETSKKGKKAKAKKEKKMGTGTKVYIVISILLILGLAGVGVWGYFHYEDKLDKAETDKQTMVADYESQISVKETEISNLNASVTDAQSQVLSLEAEVADYELSLAESQAAADSYATYDGLISFANGSVGGAVTDLFVSDSVLHLTQGTDVTVLVYYPINEGLVEYVCTDKNVATCEWGEWVSENVISLTVHPTGSGNATITVSNDQNEATDVIYIYVD